MGRWLPIIGGGGLARLFSAKGGGALVEEALISFQPGPRPPRDALIRKGSL